MGEEPQGTGVSRNARAGGSADPSRDSFSRTLRRYFFTGLIVLLPVAISVYVLWRLFFALDHILGRFYESLLGYRIPGLGFVALLAIILAVGAIASNIIGRKLIGAIEGLVARVPVVRWIYRTTKQLFSTLLGERSTSFRKVVLVHFPYRGSYTLAFQTSDDSGPPSEAVGQRLVTLFVPTTPNPTSGYLLLVPEEDTVPLDISVNEGLKMIVTAGALTGPYESWVEAGARPAEPRVRTAPGPNGERANVGDA